MKLIERISIAKLTIAQMTFIFLSFMALGISMKINGYPENYPERPWLPMALTLRKFGLLALFVPLLLSVVSFYCTKVDSKVDFDSVALLSVFVTIGLMIMFVFYAISPYSRPLMMAS